jgi:hypothetical protein
MGELFEDYLEVEDRIKAVRISQDNLDDFVFRTNVLKATTVYEDGVTIFTFEWEKDHKRNPLVVKAGDYIVSTQSEESGLEYHQRAQFTVVPWREFQQSYERDEFVFSPEEIRILKGVIDAYRLDPKKN